MRSLMFAGAMGVSALAFLTPPAVASSTPDRTIFEYAERDCGEVFGLRGNVSGAHFSPRNKGELGRVRLTGSLADPWPGRREALIVAWELSVVRPGGEALHRVDGTSLLEPGEVRDLETSWDGTDSEGEAVAAGRYYAQFRARAVNELDLPASVRDELLSSDFVDGSPVDAFQTLAAYPHDDSPFVDQLTIVVDPGLDERQALHQRELIRPTPSMLKARNEPHVPGTYYHWYGNPHSHSTRSDGGGTAPDSCTSSSGRVDGAYPYHLYEIAKSSGPLFHPADDPFLGGGPFVGGELDWLMVADHNHLIDSSPGRDGRTPGIGEPAIYQEGLADAEAATTDDFVGIYGVEWGTVSGCGHVMIYDSPLLTGWEWYADVNVPRCQYAYAGGVFDMHSRPDLVSEATGRPHMSLAHPDSDHFDSYDRTPFADAAVRGVAVIQGSSISCAQSFPAGGTGTSSGGTYKNRYVRLLDDGWRIGPEGHQDNHGDNVGSHSETRTVFLAAGLTKACLLKAQWSRRVYATQNRNAQLIFTATPASSGVTHPMGSEVGGLGGVTLRASWSDPDREPMTEFTIKLGRVGAGCTFESCLIPVASFAGVPRDPEVLEVTISPPGGAESFFIVNIEQEGVSDTGSARTRHTVSAPIWVDPDVVDLGQLEQPCIRCGDGLREAQERCDDGNNDSCDGCSATCRLETGCGDGVVCGAEQCDDGNLVGGDGCDSGCRSECGFEYNVINPLLAVKGGSRVTLWWPPDAALPPSYHVNRVSSKADLSDPRRSVHGVPICEVTPPPPPILPPHFKSDPASATPKPDWKACKDTSPPSSGLHFYQVLSACYSVFEGPW